MNNILKNSFNKLDIYQKRILKIYFYILTLGTIYAVIINFTSLSIPCIFYKTTGFLCPGCGLSRMCNSFIHFQFINGILYNPFAFLSAIFWIIYSISFFIGIPRKAREPKICSSLIILFLVLGVLWTFLRNIL